MGVWEGRHTLAWRGAPEQLAGEEGLERREEAGLWKRRAEGRVKTRWIRSNRDQEPCCPLVPDFRAATMSKFDDFEFDSESEDGLDEVAGGRKVGVAAHAPCMTPA